MAKYRVYAIATASWLVGTYEAGTKEEAEKMANEDNEAVANVRLCHQCAGEVEIGDWYEIQVEEV